MPKIAFPMLFVILAAMTAAAQTTIKSPDGRIRAVFSLDANGEPGYEVRSETELVLERSKLGLLRDDENFSKGLAVVSVSRPVPVRDRYDSPTSKRRYGDYRATRVVIVLAARSGNRLEVIFQVSNDGVAFRYRFPEKDAKLHKLLDESTSFNFKGDALSWLQPKAPAGTGWSSAQPSYEEYYLKGAPVGARSALGAGWVFPALFQTDQTWVLITESGFQRNYCGGSLAHESPGGEYKIAFPDAKETRGNREPVNPESTLPWSMPWRVIVVGSLKTIVESTLGTDLAEPARSKPDPSLPGKASWSWVLLGDARTNFETQRNFVDYAADMGWRYCLVDALWDKQIGYDRIKELASYAATKGVKLILWYNSAGSWNTAPQTPRSMLLSHEDRMREFKRLKEIGIAGLKVDFFGGDGQSFMNYYRDLLDDASQFGFVMNFHGATIPRGLARTYPNLMTMEAVRGFEYVTFAQENAEQEATHAAMLPFTRNVFDPMDFTPVSFDQVNKWVTRRTRSAFELALSVLFTSGIQHYAETPAGMAKAPDFVRRFMSGVPSVWDDVKFIDGYPGKFAVLARRAGKQWYIAGINAETMPRRINLELRKLSSASFELITDGDMGNLSFVMLTIDKPDFEVTIPPNGGFVMVSK